MRHRRTLGLVLSLLLLSGVAACGDDDVSTDGTTTTSPGAPAATAPDREPDVTGVVARAGGASPALADASDEYFEGMDLLRGDPVIVDEATGEALTAADLDDGAEVAVWTEDACAESYPVQCQITALQVRR